MCGKRHGKRETKARISSQMPVLTPNERTYTQRHGDTAVVAGVQGEQDAPTGLSLIF